MLKQRPKRGSNHQGDGRSAEHPVTDVSRAFIEHSALLKKFLKRYLFRSQDIEDVVQEAFLKAYSAEKDRHIEQPKAFLFSIAKNLALNELRRKSRQMTDSIETCMPNEFRATTGEPELELAADRNIGLYCEAVAALPERCRRVYLLRKVHGMRHKEIAQHLGITLSSVEKHLRKGTLSCEAYINKKNHSPLPSSAAHRNRGTS